MRVILFLLAGLVSQQAFSQKNEGIKLKKGHAITVVSTSLADGDFGMGMEIKNNSTATNKLIVFGETDSTWLIIDSLVRLKMNVEMMGQEQSFDSDKPEDLNSEAGKEFNSRLHTPDTIAISKADGRMVNSHNIPETSMEESGANPMGALMKMSGAANNNQVIANAFLVISGDKKIGDSWTDSTVSKERKSASTFTMKSINEGMAKIQLIARDESTSSGESMGNQVDVTVTSKTTGDILLNMKTFLVNEKILVTEVSGTMEVMGQSLPFTSKVTSTFTYQ